MLIPDINPVINIDGLPDLKCLTKKLRKMKNLTRSFYFLMILLGLAGLSSCEKQGGGSGTGEADFSVLLPSDQTLKSAMTDSTDTSEVVSYHVLVSVVDENGEEVLSDELIPLYQFGDGFVSEKVKLDAGRYALTKFMVIDPSGKVLYAAPMKGSPLAYLVDKPLPIPFGIRDGQVTRVTPEVLPVGNGGPEDFGYVSFGVAIVRPLDFFTICYLDNPEIMAPTRPTEARLTVYDEKGWHYTFRLRARVNHLVIRGGSDVYKFIVEKKGFETQKLEVTARELEATTPREPLVLTIPYGGGEYKKLVLQPGPEKGKDAMICNLDPDKNFGDHRYFETTFLPDSSMLTVMRSTRSLIDFDLNALPKSARIKKVILQLYYDAPIPWDTNVFVMDPASAQCPWYGAVLQKITEPWEEHKVTWNTQPKTTEDGQVYVSPFRPYVCGTNFIRLDVTSLYMPVDGATDCEPGYGMLFRLWPDERFPGFRFASSDYPVPYMRPKLIILYTMDR